MKNQTHVKGHSYPVSKETLARIVAREWETAKQCDLAALIRHQACKLTHRPRKIHFLAVFLGTGSVDKALKICDVSLGIYRKWRRFDYWFATEFNSTLAIVNEKKARREEEASNPLR